MTSFLGSSMQNWVSFESMWHMECDESYCESTAQLHRTRWVKNLIPGSKIENRLWKSEKHFQIKTNVHFGYDRTQWTRKKSVAFQEHNFFRCLFHSVMSGRGSARLFFFYRITEKSRMSGRPWSRSWQAYISATTRLFDERVPFAASHIPPAVSGTYLDRYGRLYHLARRGGGFCFSLGLHTSTIGFTFAGNYFSATSFKWVDRFWRNLGTRGFSMWPNFS